MSLQQLMKFHEGLGGIISDTDGVLRYGNNDEQKYNAVRNGIGIFDYSYMNVFSVKGDGASEFLNKTVAGNIQFLEFYHVLFTVLLDEHGRIMDLLYIYRTMDGFLITASASQREKVMSFFNKHKPEGVDIIDEYGKYAIIALEGVYSWEIAKAMVGADVVGLRYLSFFKTSFESIPDVYCVRCGITGEYGFRFIFPIEFGEYFLNYLIQYQTGHQKEICGMEVLSVLTQEVRFPSFGQGIDEGDSPIEKGLNWMIDLRKESYFGKEAVENEIFNDQTPKMVGFVCDSRFDSITAGNKVLIEDEEIGNVVISSYSYKMGKTIGYVLLQNSWACVGIDAYHVQSEKEKVKITTMSTAFFLTESIKVQMV
jgi:aminomethyltransferase